LEEHAQIWLAGRPDDGLTAGVDVQVFDNNLLLALATVPVRRLQ